MRFMGVLAVVMAVTAGVESVRPGQAGAIALKVSTRARYLRPGEVVLLTVVPSRPLAALRGEAFGHGVGFWRAGNDESWQGLAGIPLDAEPGSHRITIHGTGRDGREATASIPLQLVPARFRTRRLRVDDRFLNPPEEISDRIRREAETLRELFDRVRPGRLWDGVFGMPVPGPVTSAFGRLTVLNGTPRGRHQGSDLRAEAGTPVRAPQSGEVVLADDLYYSGNTVIVDHGEGLYSLVAHLSHIAVKVGDRVEREALLGESGATGRVTAPHLHWAVRLQGVPVDPLSLAAAVAKRESR
jgi:murein DD-endopeptidase MepM/ murein hydrolase activator NlpD